MTKEVAIKEENNAIELSVIEQVVMQGDLSKLTPQQRVIYYHEVCKSCGLNPYTRPFDYIMLNGKLTLYARKDCTEQLRGLRGISIGPLKKEFVDDLYIVTATATTKDNRTDESTGVVTIGNLKGDAKANALMKAETKAKRRVTLSISGMGWVDESEIESIPNAKTVDIDISTGEIKESKKLMIENKEDEAEKNKYIALLEDMCRADPDIKTIYNKKLNYMQKLPFELPVATLKGLATALQAELEKKHALRNTLPPMETVEFNDAGAP